MAAKRHTPTVRLRRLAAELRRLRTAAALTREVVTDRTGINEATLYRIETARVRPQRRTLTGLLDLYEVGEPQRSDVLELLTDSGKQGWLRPYHSDLPDAYVTYIGFEAEARAVRNYESLCIPGLLQTEDYARAVIKGILPMAGSIAVEQRVQARIDRQAVLTRDEPLKLWAIIDEAAARRMVGGPGTMAAQMEHLVAMTGEPNVTLQVIPFSAGAHPGMTGSVQLMDFPEVEDPLVVYIDGMAGDLFIEAQADIRRYGAIFDSLRAVALGPDQSASLIATLAKEGE